MVINALGGDDTINATGLPAAAGLQLTFNGGPGADTLIGGESAETFNGGAGDDIILAGGGDDIIAWSPGDGNDTIEGQGGYDTLLFTGSNIAEIVDVLPNGSRVMLHRNVANITLDCDGVEELDVRLLGGADLVTVDDLAGTDVTRVRVDLSSSGGTGDGAADSVVANGTAGDDVIDVSSSPTATTVSGLTATIVVARGEPANDRITVNGLGADDTIDASGVAANAGTQLTLNGGPGTDILIGGESAETFNGGGGDDLILAGGGDDIIAWSPGDGNDTIEGQGRLRHAAFLGVQRSRNDRRDAERRARGAAPECRQYHARLQWRRGTRGASAGRRRFGYRQRSAGTDVTRVQVDLSSTVGTGDGAADSVVANGTAGDDVIVAAGSPATGATILMGSHTIAITGAEAASDGLRINALGGSDAVDASATEAGVHRPLGFWWRRR